MSEEHRPGPWILSKYRDGSSIIIIDADGFDVATVHYPNRDATARLIASAPELAKEIDALKAENERLRELLAGARHAVNFYSKSTGRAAVTEAFLMEIDTALAARGE